MRQVAVGRVGRPHGWDGSFYVENASHALPEGLSLTLAGREAVVERRAGTDARPLVRLSGVEDPGGLRGEALLVLEAEAPLEEGEWLATDLIGLRIEGLGTVTRVLPGESCDVLELSGSDALVPLVSDAILVIDPDRGVIEVDRAFLGLDS